jgi:hypothetical protein
MSSFDADGIAKVFDVFFNGRPASDPKSKVTIEELARRGTSTVRIGERFYRVQVTEIEPTK